MEAAGRRPSFLAMIDTLLETLALFASASVFGAMVFFPSVVAPMVFRSLDAASAGQFLRALFPGYYAFIVVGSALAAAALVSAPGLAAIMAAIALSTLAVRQMLVPQINAWRDAELAGDAAAAPKFAAGHRVSVIINMVQLAGVVWVLWRLV